LFDANELGESFWQDFQAADLILTNRSPNRHDAYKILALQLHDRQKNLDVPLRGRVRSKVHRELGLSGRNYARVI